MGFGGVVVGEGLIGVAGTGFEGTLAAEGLLPGDDTANGILQLFVAEVVVVTVVYTQKR